MAKNYKTMHQLFKLASLVHQLEHMQIVKSEFEFNGMEELDVALRFMQLEKSSKLVGLQSIYQENNTNLQLSYIQALDVELLPYLEKNEEDMTKEFESIK